LKPCTLQGFFYAHFMCSSFPAVNRRPLPVFQDRPDKNRIEPVGKIMLRQRAASCLFLPEIGLKIWFSALSEKKDF